MDKHALWKWLILIALAAWSLALVIPPRTKVKLGLDLRGGTSFTLQMDEQELEKQIREESPDLTPEQVRGRLEGAVRRAQEQALEIIRNRVDALGVAEPLIYPERHNRIVVQIPGLKETDRDRAARLIQSAAYLVFSIVHEDNDKLVAALFEKGLAPAGYRIGSLPGATRSRDVYLRDPAVPDEALDAAFRATLETFQAPPGYRFMLQQRVEDGRKHYLPWFVRQRYELRGDSLKTAGIEYDQLGQPYVTLKFDAKGARKFARVTAEYAPGGARNPNPQGRRYLAIILDDTLYSAPFLKTAIYGGEAIIEGGFSLKEAQDLAIVLRAGSLPSRVQIIESRSVDPSLGRDTIASSTRATLYACVLVVLFMVVYYRFGGLVADLALLFNLILLPLGMMITAGIMSLFSGGIGGSHIGLPVLTLPGIAGIALTIGMAVDANVLIFERMREEQALGKRLGPAVEGGYAKAFVTILDSNLTTVMAAVILFLMGSGAVRGFGVTLTAGIMVSMYTALMLTRMVFNLVIARGRMPYLKMMALIRPSTVDFIRWRHLAIGASLAVSLASWGWMTARFVQTPAAVFGTDFTGGSAVTFQGVQKPDVERLRAALDAAGVKDAQIQYQRSLDKAEEVVQIRAAYGSGDTVKRALAERFPEARFTVVGEDTVGPQIGREMTGTALRALLYATIGMVLYIAWRFEFSFGIGAIVAMLHDVIVSLGLFCLCGRQIGATTVAALLTIVGYSVNDTIVIFDRIRENLRKHPGKSVIEICNLSINETLSRTLLTGTTTLLALLMLLLFGGGAINDFALLMLIGIVVGTYSSIYIATPVMLGLRRLLRKPDAKVLAR